MFCSYLMELCVIHSDAYHLNSFKLTLDEIASKVLALPKAKQKLVLCHPSYQIVWELENEPNTNGNKNKRF